MEKVDELLVGVYDAPAPKSTQEKEDQEGGDEDGGGMYYIGCAVAALGIAFALYSKIR